MAQNVEADVCVIGAGITGLTVAYLLSRTHRVIVLDRYGVGAGDSGRTTAHLSHVLDRDYGTLANIHGDDGARLAAESHSAAIDFIERTVAEEGLECEFERINGFLIGGPGQEGKLDQIREGARKAGLSEVQSIERASFEGMPPGPCLRFPRQAQFHPLRYLEGLAAAIERRGGAIHGGTSVSRVSDGATVRAETSRGPSVVASAIVMATHAPLGGKPGIHARQTADRSYVIAGPVPRGQLARELLWDTADPYHYVRVAARSSEEDMLVVGGEDHPTGRRDDAAARYENLERWARERFPSLGAIAFRWSGQIVESADGLGFVGTEGKRKGRRFFSTGHSGNGFTHGTLSGIVLASQILNGHHPWESLYDPARKSRHAAPALAGENPQGAAQLGGEPGGGDVDSEHPIAPGTAVILRRGGAKIAAYRDEDGNLWQRSAICPHMGCVVHWNSGERSWDCPCHASRFDFRGWVLNGPASEDLTEAPPVKKAGAD